MHASAGYISPNEIISDVIAICDDMEFKAFEYAFYLSQVQQALSELAYDTLFDQRTWTGAIPPSLVLDLPDGLFNLEQVYVFSGTDCSIGNLSNVYWARHFFRHGGATVKEQRGVQTDPFLENTTVYAGGILYFNISGGKLYLSDACAGFQNVLVQYRGMGCKLGDAPMIPHYLREAVKNFVAKAILTVRFARDPGRWSAVLDNVKRDHFGNGGLDAGTWKQAQRRVQSIDIKARNDIARYLSNLSLKITP